MEALVCTIGSAFHPISPFMKLGNKQKPCCFLFPPNARKKGEPCSTIPLNQYCADVSYCCRKGAGRCCGRGILFQCKKSQVNRTCWTLMPFFPKDCREKEGTMNSAVLSRRSIKATVFVSWANSRVSTTSPHSGKYSTQKTGKGRDKKKHCQKNIP